MNLIDAILLIIMVWSTWRGLQQGLIAAVIGLVGWIIALYAGSIAAKSLAGLFAAWSSDPAVQIMLAFAAVVMLVLLMLWGVGLLVRSVLHAMALGWLERLAGGAFGLLRSVFVMLIVLSVIAPLAKHSPKFQQSILAPALLPYAPLAMDISKKMASHAWQRMQ